MNRLKFHKAPPFNLFNRSERYIFVIVFLCSVFFSEIGYQTSNYSSRFFLTKAIVDHQTFRIDFHAPRFGSDWSLFRGHFFSDKPPGSSLMMIPQYILLGKPAEFVVSIFEPEELWKERIVAWVVQISSLSLYTAMAFVGLYRLFGLLGLEKHRFSLTLLSYFGTLMFLYSTVGTGEMFTVPLVVWGLVFLLKEPRSRTNLLCSGLFFGLGCLTTNQVIFFAFPASILVLFQRRKHPQDILYFAAPLMLFWGLIFLYNWINFDSILAFPVKYWRGGANTRVVWLEFPSPSKVLRILFLPSEGIFFYSPFLVLSIPGYRKLLKNRPPEIAFFLVSCFLLYFFFLASLEGAKGAAFGSRYIVPALPFLCIGAATWLSERKKLTPAEITLLILSICFCSAGAFFGFSKELLDYNVPFLLSIPVENFITSFFLRNFGITHWLLRAASTTAFFGLIGAILLKYQASPSENMSSGNP